MERNASPADRIVRAVLGTALVGLSIWGLGVAGGSVLGIVSAALGGVLLVTAATGFCPLYKLFGIKSCRSC